MKNILPNIIFIFFLFLLIGCSTSNQKNKDTIE